MFALQHIRRRLMETHLLGSRAICYVQHVKDSNEAIVSLGKTPPLFIAMKESMGVRIIYHYMLRNMHKIAESAFSRALLIRHFSESFSERLLAVSRIIN
jgi:hypothetical protein